MLDNSQRSQIAVYVFWAIVITSIIAIVSGWIEIQLLQNALDGEFITDEEAESNDLRQAIVGLLQTIVRIVSIVVFLQWFRRAYANVSRAGISTEENDSWAIWGFVIPIISLYKPYQMTKEMVTKMHERVASNSVGMTIPKAPYALIGWWWALFLITNVIGNVAMRSIFDDETLEGLATSSQIYLFSDLADIPAALLTLFMIREISVLEQRFSKTGESDQILSEFGTELKDANTESDEDTDL